LVAWRACRTATPYWWDVVSSTKPNPVTEAQPVFMAAAWGAGRVSARLQQKFEWYPLAA
jgi:hypothetical protein